MKKNNKKCASQVALKDISKYLNDNNLRIKTGNINNPDIWYVGRSRIYTKDQIALNRELGINSINYLGNTNGSNQKTD